MTLSSRRSCSQIVMGKEAKKLKSVAVIGGGMTGLTMGWRLTQKGYKVDVYEKNEYLGGLLGGMKIGNGWLEKAYHHIFRTDRQIIELIEELELSDRLVWRESRVGLYFEGKIYPFSTPANLLKFPPLPIIDKVRMGLVSLWLQFDKNWEKYEKSTASQFMRRYCGERAYRVIWEPLLRGKFHHYYDRISMAWLWARIHTRGGSREKDGKEYLGYMRGGFQLIVDALAKKIVDRGGRIHMSRTVEEEVLAKKYDLVISTAPSKGVEYLSAINLILATNQNLSQYYWHNINDLESPFLAVIQQTNLVDRENYGGDHVYYLGGYYPQDHQLMKASDSEIQTKYFGYLKKIFADFDEKKVKWVKINRFGKAQHIVGMNYRQKIEPYKVGKNIYHVNFSQVYPEDRGINFAVKEADKVVEIIIS